MQILWSSECDLAGSGYWNLTKNLCSRLSAAGNKIVILGHEYHGQPHDFPFTIVPSDFRVLRSQVEAIKQAHFPDLIVCSWDIPAQRQLSEWFAKKGTALYVGLFPVEAGPLAEIDEWCGYIRSMDLAFVISEFGLAECRAAGLDNVVYLPVGIDHNFFQPPTPQYREELRHDLGLTDKHVMITVADNHFRKNLSAGIQILAEAVKQLPNLHYVLVSRPHQRSIGWSLKELAARYDVLDHITIVHSRPSNEMLLRFYQCADVYLCTSHAEGLGLPILEAQACSVPVVSGDWTAMGELIACGKGVAVGYETEFIDPFGNQTRFLVDVKQAADAVVQLAHDTAFRENIQTRALAGARERNFDRAAAVFIAAAKLAGVS